MDAAARSSIATFSRRAIPRRCHPTRVATTALRHVVADEPYSWDLWAGARGVQLAELGLLSARDGRRIEIPELDTAAGRG